MCQKQNILDYARNRNAFTIQEARNAIAPNATMESMDWYLNQLVKAGTLTRVATGTFQENTKCDFSQVPQETAIDIQGEIHTVFPFAKLCVYDSTFISPLQHHLSGQEIIYVEVDRVALQSVFFALRDTHDNVFLRPTKDVLYNYVDNNRQAIFVKPLISEAPLKKVDNYPLPTLEKLLVDLLVDPDFFMYQGAEYDYIFEKAYSLYNINRTKLLRYASRRGIREEMQKQLEKYDK